MADDISILKAGQWRLFIQHQGSSPANPYEYVGCLQFDGLSEELGEETPIYCPSADLREEWDIVDSTRAQRGLPTTDFTQHADRSLKDFWFKLRRTRCKINAVAVASACANPSDINDFEGKIILRTGSMTSFNLPTMNPLSGDDNAAFDISGSLQFREFDELLPIKFEEVADTTLVAEALDALYADAIQCGDCGTPSDGCQKAFLLTQANGGSPGLSSQIVYTSNGFATSGSVDIPSLGGLSGNRMAKMGQYLVVVSEATASHHYSLITDVLAGTVAWTEVATGYVNSPRCIWNRNAVESYIGGAGGYIYLLTNPTGGVTVLSDGSITAQNFNDVHGKGQTIVLVGNSNALVVSTNGGSTFSLVTGPEVGQNLSAVWVLSNRVWWVGTGNGNLYYTLDGGTTWVENTPNAAITTINDIQFVDEVVGYIAVQVGGAGRIYRTADNGYSWFYQSPYLSSLPTAERYNVVVPCGYNTLLAAGRKTVGGDGIAVVAS